MTIEIRHLASSSSGNAYLITDRMFPPEHILIDCGIPFKQLQRMLNHGVSKLVGCLISHEHLDHSKSAVDLMKAGIDVFTSAGTVDVLKLTGHRINRIQPRKQFRMGQRWTILPFEVEHDAVEPFGFLIAHSGGDKLLYVTDSYYVRYKFTGLTHIMVECNYAADILDFNVSKGNVPAPMKKRIRRSHMSIETVKEFLLANDLSMVREIHLLHLSDGNSDAGRFKREIEMLTGKPVYIADK